MFTQLLEDREPEGARDIKGVGVWRGRSGVGGGER